MTAPVEHTNDEGRARRDRAHARNPICDECKQPVARASDADIVVWGDDERDDVIAHTKPNAKCFVRAVMRINQTFSTQDAARRAEGRPL